MFCAVSLIFSSTSVTDLDTGLTDVDADGFTPSLNAKFYDWEAKNHELDAICMNYTIFKILASNVFFNMIEFEVGV